MANNGKEYELFVSSLQQALLNAENITTQKNITVEVNKLILDNCGIERQFDIYWEYELGGLTYKTVIECKDYNSSVSVEKIDALIGKTRDIPDLKAVFATKKGYQSGGVFQGFCRLNHLKPPTELVVPDSIGQHLQAPSYG
nr:hypothetical protein [Ferrovum myxofaciens]